MDGFLRDLQLKLVLFCSHLQVIYDPEGKLLAIVYKHIEDARGSRSMAEICVPASYMLDEEIQLAKKGCVLNMGADISRIATLRTAPGSDPNLPKPAGDFFLVMFDSLIESLSTPLPKIPPNDRDDQEAAARRRRPCSVPELSALRNGSPNPWRPRLNSTAGRDPRPGFGISLRQGLTMLSRSDAPADEAAVI